MGKARACDPIGKFFARYNQFDYDAHSEAWSEYHRMTAFFNWKKDGKKERAANALFREAIVSQFELLYGVNENKLATLQLLCLKLEVLPVPGSVTSCKKVVSSTSSYWDRSLDLPSLTWDRYTRPLARSMSTLWIL